MSTFRTTLRDFAHHLSASTTPLLPKLKIKNSDLITDQTAVQLLRDLEFHTAQIRAQHPAAAAQVIHFTRSQASEYTHESPVSSDSEVDCLPTLHPLLLQQLQITEQKTNNLLERITQLLETDTVRSDNHTTEAVLDIHTILETCLLYTSPSPRD